MNDLSKSSEQTRKNLIEAFLKLYRGKTINKITVLDVSKKAGYTRATFYNYFVNVYDLREQIQNKILEDVDACHKSYVDPTIEQDSGILRDFFHQIYRTQHAYLSVLLGKNADPIFYKKYEGLVKANVLKMFASHGLPENDPHLDYLSTLYSQFFVLAIHSWYETGLEHMPEDVMETMHKFKFGELLRLAKKWSSKDG